MMKNEFLALTGFTETAIDDDRYFYIENAYMNTDETKQAFAKRFYKEYCKAVAKPIDMLIKAKTLQEKTAYIYCNETTFDDVDRIYNALFVAFCKTFK